MQFYIQKEFWCRGATRILTLNRIIMLFKIFGDVMPCWLVNIYQRFRQCAWSQFAVPRRSAQGRCHAEASVLEVSSRPVSSRLPSHDWLPWGWKALGRYLYEVFLVRGFCWSPHSNFGSRAINIVWVWPAGWEGVPQPNFFAVVHQVLGDIVASQNAVWLGGILNFHLG